MMTNSEARSMAAEINSAVLAHDGGTAWNAIFPRLKALDEADRDLVHKFQGLDMKARDREAQRKAKALGRYQTDRPQLLPNHRGVIFGRARWNDDSTTVNTRFYVVGKQDAQWLWAEFEPEENHAAYSPTGRWFRGSRSIRRLRGNVWLVQSCHSLDC